MYLIPERINAFCRELQKYIAVSEKITVGVEYLECDYKTDNNPPLDGWKPYSDDVKLCGAHKHYWFHAKFRSPKTDHRCEFSYMTQEGEGGWDLQNPQGILYMNGKLVQGLDINHKSYTLEPDTDYDMYIYLYTAKIAAPLEIELNVRTVDPLIEKVWYDLTVPFESAMILDKDDRNRVLILKYLEDAVNMIDMRVPKSEEFFKTLKDASDFLDSEFYGGVCGKEEAPLVSCIGHTHLDVAYLWTVRQTREKAQRSFATALQLIREYPDFIFMSSQPQLYQFIKEDAPELYEEIKEAIKEGSWEAEGAMWLEPDCNLLSGESLVRQILFGKRFFKDEFGIDSKILWLPDVFGYSAALPQILKKSGVDKFVTSKISWSEYNKMPYDSFMWEGIDGTEIFTYFMTCQLHESFVNKEIKTTYCGDITPSLVLGTWERYQQKEYCTNTFITYGHADGGGGPMREMIEREHRMAHGIPGMPKTVKESAAKFLTRVKKSFDENCKKLGRIPRWVGELYLEFHRGTYTSMAKNKLYNRKSEFLMRKTEGISSLAMVLQNAKYPQKSLNSYWKTMLLNQFHDIIPGSAIKEVYEVSDKEYAEILQNVEKIFSEKLSAIASQIETDGGLLVYNPHSFMADGVVLADKKPVYVKNIPPLGWKVALPEKNSSIKISREVLENKFFAIRFDKDCQIVSIYDKRNCREIIKQNSVANEIQMFEDFPKDYDAWEISRYHKLKMWTWSKAESVETVDEVTRAGIKVLRRFNNSVFAQTIYVYADVDRIDFVTEIDWCEEHILLKAAFPFDIHSDKATYEVQFGTLERPTHENTSWDAAKFEVCAQKWADISEADYGISLLNDCKYGYSTEGSTMKLTLLKSATYPNTDADRTHHSFTYSLYPHKGSLNNADTLKHAYILNQPLEAITIGKQSGVLPSEYSFINSDNADVIIDTIKKAEDSDALILRMYEPYNKRDTVTLTPSFEVSRAYICDLMENNDHEIEVNDNKITIDFKNYEIVTVKLEF